MLKGPDTLGRLSASFFKGVHIFFYFFLLFCIAILFCKLFVRLSLLTMTNPNQLCNVLLFVCSKMADETNLSSKLPVADRTREV